MKRREFLGLAGAALISAPRISIAQTTPSKTIRVVVIANRYYEADGLMAAVGNQMKASPNLSLPYNVVWPRAYPADPTLSQKPRCLIDVRKDPSDSTPSATMEIWCIDDIGYTGGSGGKVTAMKQIESYTTPSSQPDAVVAFGTAAYSRSLLSFDGCAAIGGTIFLHDSSNGAPGSWSWPGNMDKLIPSQTPASFFSNVSTDQATQTAISSEMIAPQNHPAGVLQLIIAADAVGISSVNESPPYCAPDSASVALAQQKGATNITSVETTHGVIRSVWDKPFIYVTAITNRLCHFPDEASGIYAQEFPSSHNAGVALKHAIPYFVSAIA
jgi:hypothetical protein